MDNTPSAQARLNQVLTERFGDTIEVPDSVEGVEELLRIAGHSSHRRYADRPVDPQLLDLLCACALSAPSKSDLQQADIVQVNDPALRAAIADLIPTMPWVRAAPGFLVFCANGRRIRTLSELRGKVFANDHLDAFMNATVDAAIVLTTFLRAATAAGLGCCPISVIRNHAEAVSTMLALPDLVYPIAGMCVGYPAETGATKPRLPLALTLHRDRYDESEFADRIDAYDRRRPYDSQRDPARFGTVEAYGWSEDKARQYAVEQRADFDAFIRRKGFNLD